MPTDLKEWFKQRVRYLIQLIETTEKALANAQDGRLHIVTKDNHLEYYKIDQTTPINGIYISKKDMKTAKELAQKGYYRKVLWAAQKELVLVKRLSEYYEASGSVEDVVFLYSKAWQDLIQPIWKTDDQFIDDWKKGDFQKKPVPENSPYITNRGETVRSKSELLYANEFDRYDIPYIYEKPILIKGLGTVYIDFTTLCVKRRKTIYVEHFGLIDERDYRNDMLTKLHFYMLNGLFPGDNFLCTFETAKSPLSTKDIRMLIEHYYL
ncbi:MAG: hypothetical protein VZR02_03770 [Lachnospiraceae bacterium]|nr:hypothetical protein [Lachnospiraceae bacterium]